METPIVIQLTIYLFRSGSRKNKPTDFHLTVLGSGSSDYVQLLLIIFLRVLHVYVSQTSKCRDFTFLMKNIYTYLIRAKAMNYSEFSVGYNFSDEHLYFAYTICIHCGVCDFSSSFTSF